MTQMPFAPGAGPSSGPISRSTSPSSHVESNPSISDDEEEWLEQFRAELQQNQKARLAELLQQAEDEFRRASSSLFARRKSSGYDHMSPEAYDAARVELLRAFDAQKLRAKRLLQEEAEMVIKQERASRKLSLGEVDSEDEQAKAVIAEQEELLKMYEARAQRAGSVDVRDADPIPQAPSTTQPTRWRPPARSLQAQKSNTSDTPSARRGSSTAPKPTSNLTSDLYANQHRSSGPSYQSWVSDAPFPSAEPDDMPDLRLDEEVETDNDFDDSDYNNEDGAESTDNGDGGNGSDSGSDDDYGNMTLGGQFLLSAEDSFGIAPSASLNTVRGGTHQSSLRGRPAGRTPPPETMMPYSAHVIPVRKSPHDQTQSRANSQGLSLYWKPSKEDIGSTFGSVRSPPLVHLTYNTGTTRRPSLGHRSSNSDAALTEQEKVREEGRSREGTEGVRNAGGLASGVPGASAFLYVRSCSSSASSASSVQGPARLKADGLTKIWLPREINASMPNVSAMSDASETSNANKPPTPISAEGGSPGANSYIYRPRNDSDTSSGSSVRRRRSEEKARKEKELALRRQQEEEDKKRVEDAVIRKLEKDKEDALRVREQQVHRRWEEERKQEELDQRAKDTVRCRRKDEQGRAVKEALKQQEGLLRPHEPRKRQEEARERDPKGASNSFSSSIPNPIGAFSSASGSFPPGRAASSASSIHSNWSGSQRSSASTRFAASDFSRASTASSATSAWSTGSRPTPSITSNSGSNRSTTGESYKASGAWRSTSAAGTGSGPSPSSGGGASSYTQSSPLSEAEWYRRQEENARKQQEQFRRDSLRVKRERATLNAASTMSTLDAGEKAHRTEERYESALAPNKVISDIEVDDRALNMDGTNEIEHTEREAIEHQCLRAEGEQCELVKPQRRKEEKERGEALRREEEKQAAAEERRKEDDLRAKEDELKRRQWALHQREGALLHQPKEEELERQRRKEAQRLEQTLKAKERAENDAKFKKNRETLEKLLRELISLDVTGKLEKDTIWTASGGYADVYVGRFKDGRQIAIKRLRIFHYRQGRLEFAKRATRELRVWSKLRHENTVDYLIGNNENS